MFHLIFGIGRDRGILKKTIGISSVTFNAQSEQLSLTRRLAKSPTAPPHPAHIQATVVCVAPPL